MSFARLNYGIKKVDQDIGSVIKGVNNFLGVINGASSPEVSMPNSPKLSNVNSERDNATVNSIPSDD